MSLKNDLKLERRNRFIVLLIVLAVLALTALALPRFEYVDLTDYRAGEPAPETVEAPIRVYTPDRVATKRARTKARRAVKPILVLHSFAPRQEAVDAIINNSERLGDSERVRSIARTVLNFFYDRGVIQKETLRQIKPAQSVELRFGQDQQSETLTRRQFEQRVVQLEDLKAKADSIMKDLYPDFNKRAALAEGIRQRARANISLDRSAYKKARKRAVSDVSTVFFKINKNETLVRKGETVDGQTIRALRALNEEYTDTQLRYGLAGLITALFGVIILGLYYRQRFADPSAKEITVLVSTGLLFSALSKVMAWLSPSLPPGSFFGFPFAAAVMVLVVFTSEIPAAIVSILLAVYLLVILGTNTTLFLAFIFGGLVALFFAREIEQRSTVLYGGLFIGAAQVVGVAGALLMEAGSLFAVENMAMLIWAGSGGAIIVPFTVLGLIPFYENIFNVTTSFRLLELADQSHPALQELFQEAPGTFQHSIALSNICEQAARSIGADTLLVRVGCYYHDIGKASHPEYFIENQQGDNPHDELDEPRLSASILRAHVKRGIERADEHGLPSEIKAFIEEHHGTTTMEYFYQEALKSDDDVEESSFQYPGPKPQSRETALCMIGDAVEAACRALDEPKPQKIEKRVTEIVYDKFSSGQLDECDLTLRELNTIIDSLTQSMTSIHHRRIEYPDYEDLPEEPGADEG